MSIRSAVATMVYGLDDAWCRTFLATVGDRPGLLAFMFHAVGSDDGDGGRLLDPAQTLPCPRSMHSYATSRTPAIAS